MDYIFLALGFAILLTSGHFLVKSASQIAIRFNIPKIVIGLLVVSFGTSAPELIVSVRAALNGHPEIAMGNVVGSNIANIALVLGLTAIIFPIVVKRKSILFDWTVMFLSSLLLYILSLDGQLQLLDGLIFLLILGIYIFVSIKFRKTPLDEISTEKNAPMSIALLYLSGSIVGMYFGAEYLIDSASKIALNWGISERIVSVTIIAFGTSVPELATSVIAALKKEMEISIGNIVGSNIFNILSILGITTVVHPIAFDMKLVDFDMLWMLGISVALLLSIIPIRKGRIGRINGLLFVLIYLSFVLLQFI